MYVGISLYWAVHIRMNMCVWEISQRKSLFTFAAKTERRRAAHNQACAKYNTYICMRV